jgi:hypothetical protein
LEAKITPSGEIRAAGSAQASRSWSIMDIPPLMTMTPAGGPPSSPKIVELP